MSVEVDDVDEESGGPDRLIGEILANRYQIETRLGEGAMGAVYRARHIKVGRPFAVKVLHARLTEDNKVLQRFEREAELAGRLRHPNVIGVVDVGETADGMRYMVMDFAEGPDLASVLNEAPFPPQRIMHLTRQLLEGLYHAHEHGLIHRDFKPENVIIERDTHGEEVPRIVDFGIAILREGGDSSGGPGRLTTNGLVLGTPHYMAPEQAVADPIDHRIDLFALGIIIYEMLCGKLPFDGTGAEVARANLMLDPPAISDRVPFLEVDPLLEALSRRLMAKKRDLRPPSAKAARDLLDLIERDRHAAAAALGVPLGVAVRPPMTTQPNAPVAPRGGNQEGTFPPPFRGQLNTPPQAPPMSTPVAVLASDKGQRNISTQMAEPLAKSKRFPLIIGASLLLAGAGVFAVTQLGGKRDQTAETKPDEPKPDLVATTPTETKPVETPTPTPTPTETKPVETPTPTPTETKPVETKPVETKPVETKPNKTHKTSKGNVTSTNPVETKPVETKPVETKPVETKPVEPVETKPAETKQTYNSSNIGSLYAAVGAELAAFESAKGIDAGSDLRNRYRYYRLSEMMGSQQKIDELAAWLLKIRHDINARK